jgi:hypothetical protein
MMWTRDEDRAVIFERASKPEEFDERGCGFDEGKVIKPSCCQWYLLDGVVGLCGA